MNPFRWLFNFLYRDYPAYRSVIAFLGSEYPWRIFEEKRDRFSPWKPFAALPMRGYSINNPDSQKEASLIFEAGHIIMKGLREGKWDRCDAERMIDDFHIFDGAQGGSTRFAPYVRQLREAYRNGRNGDFDAG